VVAVRGADGVLRAFYNVCRHHAAAVMTEEAGCAQLLRCPYHGWTYGLDGTLKGAPEFAGVENFNPAHSGLVPVRVEAWEKFVFGGGEFRNRHAGRRHGLLSLAVPELHAQLVRRRHGHESGASARDGSHAGYIRFLFWRGLAGGPDSAEP